MKTEVRLEAEESAVLWGTSGGQVSPLRGRTDLRDKWQREMSTAESRLRVSQAEGTASTGSAGRNEPAVLRPREANVAAARQGPATGRFTDHARSWDAILDLKKPLDLLSNVGIGFCLSSF